VLTDDPQREALTDDPRREVLTDAPRREALANDARHEALADAPGAARLERFHREWNRRNNLSLRGAERRSNPLPDEPRYARQAGDCFDAARLAMTVSTHDSFHSR
jgi:hypothetical protein